MKNFLEVYLLIRDELREAGIEYPIKVEYYKITNEIPSRQKINIWNTSNKNRI